MGRVSCGWPQRSNQPGQYSVAKSGCAGAKGGEGGEAAGGVAGAEVDAGEDAGKRAVGEGFRGVDGVEEGVGRSRRAGRFRAYGCR